MVKVYRKDKSQAKRIKVVLNFRANIAFFCETAKLF